MIYIGNRGLSRNLGRRVRISLESYKKPRFFEAILEKRGLSFVVAGLEKVTGKNQFREVRDGCKVGIWYDSLVNKSFPPMRYYIYRKSR